RWQPLRQAQLRPEPRLDLVELLQTPGVVTAAMDISDGLARDAHRLARASRVGLHIDPDVLPVTPLTRDWARHHGASLTARELALYGGEDYQILFTVDPRAWGRVSKSGTFTVIGECRPWDQGVNIPDKGFD